MKSKLKCCPFCGNNAEWVGYSGGVTIDSHFVKCTNPDCNISIGPYSTEEEAIKRWNTRQIISEEGLVYFIHDRFVNKKFHCKDCEICDGGALEIAKAISAHVKACLEGGE